MKLMERMHEWLSEWMNDKWKRNQRKKFSFNESYIEWMNVSINKSVNEWKRESTNKWINDLINKWKSEWMNLRIPELKNESVDGYVNSQIQWTRKEIGTTITCQWKVRGILKKTRKAANIWYKNYASIGRASRKTSLCWRATLLKESNMKHENIGRK